MHYDQGYDAGFNEGDTPTGHEGDMCIQGWVEGRMEAIYVNDLARYEELQERFIGGQGFGKASLMDMLYILTTEKR